MEELYNIRAIIDIDCLHPLKQSAHKPVKMKNFRCKGFKKYKK